MYTGRTVLWGLRCETVLGENCTVETALLEDYAVETGVVETTQRGLCCGHCVVGVLRSRDWACRGCLVQCLRIWLTKAVD